MTDNLPRPEETRKVELWDCDDGAEFLIHRDMDDAIESHLDGTGQTEGTLKVYGFARMKIPDNYLDEGRLVEDVLERLDEEFGNWEEGTEPTEAMLEAARTFHKAIIAEYSVWTCEVVETVEVDVAEWILKERPDWTEET